MILFDASATMAGIKEETGYKTVRKLMGQSIMTAVNYAEVISTLRFKGMPLEEAKITADQYHKNIVLIDQDMAELAGDLRPATAKYGLSLGDRICLACAKVMDVPVLTADRDWKKLKLGIDIQCIR